MEENLIERIARICDNALVTDAEANRATPAQSGDMVVRVRDAIWREDHYDPKLCSHGGYGGETCAYCEPHDDTPEDWPADKERAERQARAAISASGMDELVEALTKCRDKFREYEQLHLAKVRSPIKGVHWSNKIHAENQSATDKAARNREMAEMCDATLAKIGRDEAI